MPHRTIKEHPPDTQPVIAGPRPLACRIFLHSDAQKSSSDARTAPSRSLMGSESHCPYYRPIRLYQEVSLL